MNPRFPGWLVSVAILVAGGAATSPALASPCEGVNSLTPAEKAAGWELLFDGTSTKGWHGYNGQSTKSWTIEDCALKTLGTEGNYGSDKRADLVTDREFTNFEVSIDWKTTKGGNSGLLYGVVEDKKYDAPWKTGPEYQFIDDVGFPEKLEEWQKAGADYAMHLPNDAEAAQAGGGVEQHEDRGQRHPRRALAQREEDPRVRALERRVEEAARLGQVEGRAGLRPREDRAHRDPGPRQRVLVPQRQDPPDPLTAGARHLLVPLGDAGVHSLPDTEDLGLCRQECHPRILTDQRVARDERQAFRPRLRDQQAVEGVSMQWWE